MLWKGSPKCSSPINGRDKFYSKRPHNSLCWSSVLLMDRFINSNTALDDLETPKNNCPALDYFVLVLHLLIKYIIDIAVSSTFNQKKKKKKLSFFPINSCIGGHVLGLSSTSGDIGTTCIGRDFGDPLSVSITCGIWFPGCPLFANILMRWYFIMVPFSKKRSLCCNSQ